MNKPIISIDDIKQALKFRYAAKAFDSSKKISQENIELLLEAARLAPSSYGFEPWNIIVVQEDEQLRADVKRCAGANAARFDASHILIFTAKTSEGLLQKGGHIDHMLHDIKKQSSIKAAGFKTFWRYWAKKDFEILNQPAMIHQWAARQAYIALGFVLLAAAGRRIDSCPIEGFSISKLSQVLSQHQLIDPDLEKPVVMLALGYRSQREVPAKTKLCVGDNAALPFLGIIKPTTSRLMPAGPASLIFAKITYMEDARNVIDKFKGRSEAEIVKELDAVDHGLVIALENTERDFNMGTIVRSANAFGVRQIYVIGRRQWNKRGAMMTDKYLHVQYVGSTAEFIELMRAEDRVIIAIDNIPGSVNMSEITLPKRAVLVFGQEGPGISEEMAQTANKIVAIEQFGSTRSINVGAAATVAMYCWLQQHVLR